MALASNPFGFRPKAHSLGGVIRMTQNYRIASALGSNIFTGDLVKSTGTTNRITPAAAGDTILGIFWGCTYTGTDGMYRFARYWPTGTALLANTECVANVFDDPALIYETMMATSAAADLADVCNLNAGAGGNTTTGLSGEYVDQVNNGVATQFKFYNFNKIYPQFNSTGGYELVALGSNALVELRPMKHELGGTGFGVAVA